MNSLAILAIPQPAISPQLVKALVGSHQPTKEMADMGRITRGYLASISQGQIFTAAMAASVTGPLKGVVSEDIARRIFK